MTRSALATTLGALGLLAGCATATSTAEAPTESRDRAECKEYARTFEHSGRMKDACLISRGYTVSYSTNGGGVDVTTRAQPGPPRTWWPPISRPATIRAAWATRDGCSLPAA